MTSQGWKFVEACYRQHFGFPSHGVAREDEVHAQVQLEGVIGHSANVRGDWERIYGQ